MSLTVVQRFRYCNKCQTLFFGRADQEGGTPSRCPAGDQHEPIGHVFEIGVHEPASDTAQDRWRSCGACTAMFYDGYPTKGVCPGNTRGHVRDPRFRDDYALPHDVPGTPRAQNQWRFCAKCSVMFYDGYPTKGRCAAGDGHAAAGYDFVLPHQRPS